MKSYFSVLLGLLISLLLSCGPKSVSEQYSKDGLSDLLWSRDEVQSFVVKPPDTVNAYQLVLLLRHTSRIPYETLPIALAISSEKKMPIFLKQYQFAIRDPKSGMFIGEVMGDLGDTEQVIEPEFRFKSLGDHTFSFIHSLLEDDKAKEIMELGLILREIKK
jgi:gliding motility-associated lipoprotein GldH